jgi:MFS family permease
VAALAAFVGRQARIEHPLMPLRLFRSRTVTGANAVQALLVVGMFGMFFLGALYLQQILGYDALQVGLAFLPSTIVMGAMSLRYSGPLAMRFGMRRTVLASTGLIGAGLLLFARTPVDGSYFADVLPAMVLVGLGAGLGFPGLMTFAMSGVSPQDAGMASGLVNTSVQVGGAVGLAVLATLATTRTSDLTAGGDALPAALTGGYHLAFMIGACLMVVAIAIGVFVLRPPKPAPGQAQAEAEHAEGHYSPAETVYSEVS